MARKTVLMITQYFTPDITAAAFRMSDMYEAIKDSYDVDIITTLPHKSALAACGGNESSIVDACGGNESSILRLDIACNSKSHFFKYVNEYLGFMLKALRVQRKFSKRYDYVFVTSPPIFSLLSGYLIAKKKKARLVIDIRDLWPDVLLDNETLTERNPIYRILKRFERFMYRKADMLLCVGTYMKDYISAVSGKKAYVVYNGVSAEEGPVATAAERGERDRIHIFYTGNLGFYQHLDVLFQAFESFPELRRRFQAHIIGNGSEIDRFKAWAARIGEDSIKLYGPKSKEETIEMTAADADFLFLNLHNSKTLDRTIPSKLFDYLYFNKPIIYGIRGEGKEILDQRNCGVFFLWDNAESLRKALLEAAEQLKSLMMTSAGNNEFVRRNFDRKKMFRSCWDLIASKELSS